VDPLLRRPVCAAGRPARTQVSRCVRLSGSDREFPRLTGRSGTQRARRLASRTTVRTSTPWSHCCLHLLPSDLSVLARMPVVQLDPVHETGARLFKRDRSCWKSGLRSARFTNAHSGRPSAPPRKMAADPVQRSGQTVPVRMSAFLRHISIMHLLSLGYEPTDVCLCCLGQSLVTALTSADLRREVVPGLPHLSRLSLSRCVRFTNRFTEPVLDLCFLRFHGREHARSGLSVHPVTMGRPARGTGRNPAVLQTATAQVGLCPVTCDDVRELDLRLCCVPRMSHTLGIGLGNRTVSLGIGQIIALDAVDQPTS
jgi:hypothetical protein